MCLAIPGKIIKIENSTATVDYGHVTAEASLRVAPGAKVGDTAIVHAGFVIRLLDEEEASELRGFIDGLPE